MSSVSVVVPVKDGEPYLRELLDAVAREGAHEVLVVDSGSGDRSVAIARAAGATVLEIAPSEFGHGRTRNLGASRTSGELICFLTQDATPLPGWLDAYREAFGLAERVGAAYGPHLPRPDTSPMIARELTEFFAGFSPDGGPVVQRAGDPHFLSNVNACYARACWEEIGFEDLPYAEDQAFGRALLERGWTKVYHPGARVLHAHDYGLVGFMRRYFDEYRGLRGSVGHVEPFGVRSSVRDVRRLVAADREWMRARGVDGRRAAAWTARAAAHHAGRKAFSALGSRAERLPAPVQRAISLEGTVVAPSDPVSGGAPAAVPPTEHVRGWLPRYEYEDIASFLRSGPAPLLDPVPGMADRTPLHIAMLIPPFRRGSGGHALLMQIVMRLERMGHTCSLWHVDPMDEQREPPAVLRAAVREFFGPVQAPLHKGFAEWRGADISLATGWQTVYPLLGLDGCRARAYVVNDHEPEFYATSVEAHFARESYRHGLYAICGSPWLASLMRSEYGLEASSFDYGVDHAVYRPRPVERRRDTVVFYARTVTPRRAVSVGLRALQEVKARRPDLRVVLFGNPEHVRTAFDYEFLGIADPEQLSWVFSEATVGMCLSMTNFSLIPKEMMACGLPVVELDAASGRSIFGDSGPISLAPLDPFAMASEIERLLDDHAMWLSRSEEGRAWVAGQTWERAAEQVEEGIRAALRAREREFLAAAASQAAGEGS